MLKMRRTFESNVNLLSLKWRVLCHLMQILHTIAFCRSFSFFLFELLIALRFSFVLPFYRDVLFIESFFYFIVVFFELFKSKNGTSSHMYISRICCSFFISF